MKLLRLAVLLAMLISMSGCWDMHNIEDLDFINAIGMDYVNDQYIAYGQMVDFSPVAKQEGPKPNKPAVAWVGRGRGRTVNLALNDLYQTAQQRVLWSHVGAIVFTERVMKQGLKIIQDANLRYRELRVTPWIFGTNENIEKLFTTHPFFNLSQLATLLHEPIETYRQRSWIQPMRYLYVISDGLEPGKTILLPSITINDEQWKRNEQPDPKLEIGGAFILHNNIYNGYLDNSKLRGVRWLNERTKRSPIAIKKDNEPIGTISLERPRFRIDSRFVGSKPEFSVQVKLRGNIVDLYTSISETELKKMTEDAVQKEIEYTYNQGLGLHTDVYQLEYYLYKDHYPEWHEQTQKRSISLTKDSLANIQVTVELTSSGMIKENKPAHAKQK